jgi:hypothetical protein
MAEMSSPVERPGSGQPQIFILRTVESLSVIEGEERERKEA